MRLFRFILPLSLLLLVSCGGGGGSGFPFFGGVWRGGLQLVEDGCGGAPQFAFFNHLVNQDEFQVVLDNGFLTFGGTVTSDTSFSVETERSSSRTFPGAACIETITWRYEAFDESNDVANFVVRRTEVSCDQVGLPERCAFGFSGTAVRSTQDILGPIPVDIPEDFEALVGSEGSGAVDAADL